MGDLPADDAWLTATEADRLRAFRYTKRREEARLGRWTAKRTLALALSRDVDAATLRELVIRNASDGAPEVFLDDEPAPVSISMTDRADWAVCAVVDGATSIGCDLELVEPRTERFVADWFTPSECEVVSASPGEWDLLANLIWSAKESGLKVLRTGLRRDTRSVEVRLLDAGDRDGWSALSVVTEEGREFPGWWRQFGEFVFTFASVGPTGPPRSLIEPSPLLAAVPGHSWLSEPLRGPDRSAS